VVEVLHNQVETLVFLATRFKGRRKRERNGKWIRRKKKKEEERRRKNRRRAETKQFKEM
jgi:hypothetical protein